MATSITERQVAHHDTWRFRFLQFPRCNRYRSCLPLVRLARYRICL